MDKDQLKNKMIFTIDFYGHKEKGHLIGLVSKKVDVGIEYRREKEVKKNVKDSSKEDEQVKKELNEEAAIDLLGSYFQASEPESEIAKEMCNTYDPLNPNTTAEDALRKCRGKEIDKEMIRNEFKEAEESFSLAIKMNMEKIEGYIYLAQLYIDNKDLPQAEKLLRTALEKDPNEGAIHFFLGCLYSGQGKPQLARKEMKKAEDLARTDILKAYSKKFLGFMSTPPK